MNTHQRRITLTLCAAAGGLLVAAFLPVAVAVADDFDFTPDPTTFDPTQVEGFAPLVNEVTGTEDWNLYDPTTGANKLSDVLSGVDTETTLGSITNDDFLLGPGTGFEITFNSSGVTLPGDTQVDLTDFGGGFENEWIDVPGNGTGAGVSDLLITPFGDLPLLGSIFADLGL